MKQQKSANISEQLMHICKTFIVIRMARHVREKRETSVQFTAVAIFTRKTKLFARKRTRLRGHQCMSQSDNST